MSKTLKRLTPQQRRMAVKVWYPNATDLPLVHLSEEIRAHVRRRLTPWLGNLAVEGGNCWQVAQSLVMAAGNDSGVKYVEGVWKRPWQLGKGDEPVPHAWVTVDGHRVDLIKEFYSWRCGDNEWVYEPLAEFTYSRLVELYDDNPDYADADISTMLWMENNACDDIQDAYGLVFDPAAKRLKEAHRRAA